MFKLIYLKMGNFRFNLIILLSFFALVYKYFFDEDYLNSFFKIFIFYYPIKYYYNYLKKPIIISIEGNIGSGKSTLINLIREKFNDVDVLDEPLTEWLNIEDEDNNNLLDCFYKDNKRWSYTFQNFAYITRIHKILRALTFKKKNIIITERSIYTDKNVFAKMLFDSNLMNKMEYSMYNYWFKLFEKHFNFNINFIIYLRVDPNISFSRIKIRQREEEKNIKLEYINEVHKYHDEWISASKSKVCMIDGNKEFKDNLENQELILTKIRKFIDYHN